MNSPLPPPSPTSPLPVENISLPLEIVRRLMFGSSVNATCATRLTNVDPWPKLVEESVGRFLQKADKEEKYFKIFLFATHAEVWHALDWDRSFSRRLLVVKESAKHVFGADLRGLLFDQILRSWRESGIKITEDVRALAKMLVELEDEVMFNNHGLLWLLHQWKAIKNPHKLPEWWGRKPAEDPLPDQPSVTNFSNITPQ